MIGKAGKGLCKRAPDVSTRNSHLLLTTLPPSPSTALTHAHRRLHTTQLHLWSTLEKHGQQERHAEAQARTAATAATV